MFTPPIALLAFANDREGRFLRNIGEEQRAIQQALQPLADKKLLELVILPSAEAGDIFDAFRKYKDRIRLFHYGGHARDLELMLSRSDKPFDIPTFAQYLKKQRGLKWVFMNGCATAAQQVPFQKAGIPHLVLTDVSIHDEAGKTFAETLYQNLASGRGLNRSFEEASAEVQNQLGGQRRDVVWQHLDDETNGSLPWRLYAYPEDQQDFALNVKRPVWPWMAGAASLVILVVSVYVFKPAPKPFDLTLLVQDARGKPIQALAAGDILQVRDELLTDTVAYCKIALLLDGEPKWGEIDREGNVYFRQIAPRFKNREVPVRLDECFWQLADTTQRISLDAAQLPLRITRTEKLCNLRGRVKIKFGEPLSGLLLEIRALPDASQVLAEGKSDEQGRFEITIPPDRCARQYVLQAIHPDQHYPVRDTILPESGDHLFLIE